MCQMKLNVKRDDDGDEIFVWEKPQMTRPKMNWNTNTAYYQESYYWPKQHRKQQHKEIEW